MSIFGRSLCVAAFAFSLCAWADDPIYYAGWDYSLGEGFSGYAWVDSFPDVALTLYPDSSPSDWDPDYYWEGPGGDVQWITPGEYSSWSLPYRPFSSDPAYASSTPSGPPSGGGGSPSGGGGEGGFDSVSSFGGLPSFMSGLSAAAVGAFLAASGICGSFLVWRMVRRSVYVC